MIDWVPCRLRSIKGTLGSLLFVVFPSQAAVVANVTVDTEEERSRTAAKDVPIVFWFLWVCTQCQVGS